MRPARKGPENAKRLDWRQRREPFNEAGPQGAGKPDAPRLAMPASIPSMRPARKGPENSQGSSSAAAPQVLQ